MEDVALVVDLAVVPPVFPPDFPLFFQRLLLLLLPPVPLELAPCLSFFSFSLRLARLALNSWATSAAYYEYYSKVIELLIYEVA